MTDITTKLRSLARWLRQLAAHEPEPECQASHVECSEDAEKAADEIDRLRAEVAGKDAEIARLREALGECVPALEIGLDAAHVISVFGDDRGATIREALTQARAALAPVEAK